MKSMLSVVLFCLLPINAFAAPSDHHLKPSEIEKLKQAVEDEIYD